MLESTDLGTVQAGVEPLAMVRTHPSLSLSVLTTATHIRSHHHEHFLRDSNAHKHLPYGSAFQKLPWEQ